MAKFKQVGAKTTSDEGFSVTYEDRLHVRYDDGVKAMRIAAEFLATDGVVLETTSIRAWDPPHEHEAVDRNIIVARVTAALEFSGLKVHVDNT